VCGDDGSKYLLPHTNAAHRHHLYISEIHKFCFIYRVHSSGWSATTLIHLFLQLYILNSRLPVNTHVYIHKTIICMAAHTQNGTHSFRLYHRANSRKLLAGARLHSYNVSAIILTRLTSQISSPVIQFRLSTSPPSVRLQQPSQFSQSNTYMISTSSPTGRPLRRFSCTSSWFSFLHLRTTGAKIYHLYLYITIAQLLPFAVENSYTH